MLFPKITMRFGEKKCSVLGLLKEEGEEEEVCICCASLKRVLVEFGDDVIDGDDRANLNRSARSVAQQTRWGRIGESDGG